MRSFSLPEVPLRALMMPAYEARRICREALFTEISKDLKEVFSDVRKGTGLCHCTLLSAPYAGCTVAGAGAGPRQNCQSKTTKLIATTIHTTS
jgi:hypothetical protein